MQRIVAIALFAPSVLGLACSVSIEDGQFRCVADQPETCPPGWFCRKRGITGEHRCYSSTSGICGDGRLDPEEQCDGTVFAASTTCRTGLRLCDPATCRVFCTRCGNGQLERPATGGGEECDDGNLRSRDGCSSQCRFERFAWREWRPSASSRLPPSERAAGAYDSVRKRVVLTGGGPGTWEYDGRAWTRRAASALDTPFGPQAVGYHAKAKRLVVVDGESLFHGAGGEWQRVSEFRPNVPANHNDWITAAPTMAYDEKRQLLVLLHLWVQNGKATGTALRHWEYDGATWTLQQNTGVKMFAPGTTTNHALAYDEKRQRMVLLVVHIRPSPPPPAPGQTWEHDGSTWRKVTITSPSSVGAMAYDAARGCVVMFGGNRGATSTRHDDHWEYCDGKAWVKVAKHGRTPPPRAQAALTYDKDRKRLVLVGGHGTKGKLDDTWEYFGRKPKSPGPGQAWGWNRVGRGGPYAHVDNLTIVYRLRARRLLLLPRAPDPDAPSRTTHAWERAAERWTAGLTGQRLDEVLTGPLVYDSTRAVVVAVPVGKPATVTHEYDGTAWRKKTAVATPVAFPSPLSVGAYDPDRRRVIVFGGQVGGVPSNRTWSYDGRAWTEVEPTSSPSPRTVAAMTYDLARRRMVLHGGQGKGSIPLNDTWELDWGGAAPTWTERKLPRMPPAAAHAELVYDALRMRAVMMTVADAPNAGDVSDQAQLWEYDGTQWRPQAGGRFSLTATAGSLAFDAGRRTIVRVGLGTAKARVQVWEWGADPTQSVPEKCDTALDADRDGLAGCADPDCNVDPACATSAREICDNNKDDDGDNAVDCADPNCGDAPCGTMGRRCGGGKCACPGNVRAEFRCSDGLDDDCDGKIDGADPDCRGSGTAPDASALPAQDGGAG